MCEHDDFSEFAAPSRPLTRREFGRMTLTAGLLASLPKAAFAGHTQGREVEIKTADGVADAYFVHPNKGKHPGVLIWPDIFGLRPAFKEMATRLAEVGYAVLVVNPFYRRLRAPTSPPNPSFEDPAVRTALLALKDSLNEATVQVDASAFVGFLDAQKAVDGERKIGTAGYCMGGPLVFRTAAYQAGRVGAGASFHAGGLVTTGADSAHKLIPMMRSQHLIAIAENDDAKEPQTKDVLRADFAAAKLPTEIEVYAGTKHGWCPTDSRVYDHEQAEKAWARMLALFERALSAPSRTA